jgi:predicted DNA-binding transcriptional regulator AlpA
MTRSAAAKAVSTARPAPDERYITADELRAVIPVSVMTLWRWQRDPQITFPAPVKLGADHRNYWWLPEVRTWMRTREARQRERAGRASRPPTHTA